jgi:predicted glutamine amidotransferase
MSVVTRGNRRLQVVMAEVINQGPLQVTQGLAIPAHDYVAHSYTDDDLQPSQSVYRSGGVSGTVVATVTRTFDGTGRLLSESLS